MSEKAHEEIAGATGRKAWEKPAIERVGHVGEILLGGGGKLSIQADDTGDAPRKPKGQG